jgi:PST family polysaccharide transporter
MCALFAEDIIMLALGEKWKDAVILFQIFAPTIVVLAILSPTYWLLVSIGKARRSLNIAFVLGPVIIAGYIVGLPFGPKGVAFAYSTVLILWMIPHMVWCVHDTPISWQDIMKASGKPLLSALTAGAVAFLVQLAVGQSLSPFLRIVLGGGVLIVVYVFMLLYVMRQKAFYQDLLLGIFRRPAKNGTQPVAVYDRM